MHRREPQKAHNSHQQARGDITEATKGCTHRTGEAHDGSRQQQDRRDGRRDQERSGGGGSATKHLRCAESPEEREDQGGATTGSNSSVNGPARTVPTEPTAKDSQEVGASNHAAALARRAGCASVTQRRLSPATA
jgi:hypothetical protein